MYEVRDDFNAMMAKIPDDRRPRMLPPISLNENFSELLLHLSTASAAISHLERILGEHSMWRRLQDPGFRQVLEALAKEQPQPSAEG